MKLKSNKKGFTLVELLAVIVVLAIIMIIAIPSVLENMNNAKKGSLKVYAEKALGNAQSTYQADDLLGALPSSTNTSDNKKYLQDKCYCYSLSAIGLTTTGSYKGYVIVTLDPDTNAASYKVTLTDNSFYLEDHDYDKLNNNIEISDGNHSIESSCSSVTASRCS